MSEETYDPTWVVELARQQYPEDVKLHQALAACTSIVRHCDCGCGTPYFVDLRPENPGEESDFGLRLTLEREDASPVVIDLLPDGRVACIES